jgi:cell division protein FtsB
MPRSIWARRRSPSSAAGRPSSMFRPPDRERPPRLRQLRLALLFLAALVVASVMGNRSLVRLYQMHVEKGALTQEVEQLKTTNATLAEEVRQLRTDPARVEAIAREELGLVKPGETVYEFRPAPTTAPPAPPADPAKK